MPRRDGRPWRERDNGGSRGFAHRNKGRLAGCRDRRFQTSDMGERDTLHEISEHVSRCFPRKLSDRGRLLPVVPRKGKYGLRHIGQNGHGEEGHEAREENLGNQFPSQGM